MKYIIALVSLLLFSCVSTREVAEGLVGKSKEIRSLEKHCFYVAKKLGTTYTIKPTDDMLEAYISNAALNCCLTNPHYCFNKTSLSKLIGILERM